MAVFRVEIIPQEEAGRGNRGNGADSIKSRRNKKALWKCA